MEEAQNRLAAYLLLSIQAAQPRQGQAGRQATQRHVDREVTQVSFLVAFEASYKFALHLNKCWFATSKMFLQVYTCASRVLR